MTILEAKQRLGVSDLWVKANLPGCPGKNCRSPFREDNKPSFWVSDDDQRWHDHGTGEGGDQIDFLATAFDMDNTEACQLFVDLAADYPFGPAPNLAGKPRPCSKRESSYGMGENRRVLRESMGDELAELSALRGIPVTALKAAEERGILRFGDHRGSRAWFITDEERFVAQARRLDGKMWANDRKALNLPGSMAGHLVGISASRKTPAIALVEGGPDLLAAFHFAIGEGLFDVVAPVAVLGAGIRLGQHLNYFRGKRVRIFPHVDDAGQMAAAAWTAELKTAGAEVLRFDLSPFSTMDGRPVKDLNDLCQVNPACLPFNGIFAEVKS